MSIGQRPRLIARWAWPAGLAAAVLAAQAAAPSGALATAGRAVGVEPAQQVRPAVRGTPTTVIDAKADPKAAADALNSGCADLSKCNWTQDPSTPANPQPTVAYGPANIFGDVLYNCADPTTDPDANAETATGTSDERSETTSISEKVSLKISLGFLGFEKNSVEFEAFSKQAEKNSTKVKVDDGVSVAPGWKGWNETQVLTASVTGSAFITQGIKLIQVKNVDLDFPGYGDPNDTRSAVIINGFSHPMTPEDVATRCGAVNGLGGARPVLHSRTFTLTLCRATPGSRVVRCRARKVRGVIPPRKRRATAALTRNGRAYATGTDRGGHIRLVERRKVTGGNYKLIIKGKPKKVIVKRNGKRVQTVEQNMVTIVPIAVR